MSHGTTGRYLRGVTVGSSGGCGNIAWVLTSQLCKHETLISPALLGWSDRLRPTWDPDGSDPKRNMLVRGRRGLGFGVGREPLVALFASFGPEIVATDLDPARALAAGWTDSGGEYADGIEGLNDHHLCPPEQFAARVTYRNVDMNQVPSDLGGFDFTWSSCAFEHLGNLAAGADFVVEQMRCLAPGGVAVHTTEFNVSSNDQTVESGATVLYRRRDIEALVKRLRKLGYAITCDFTEGNTSADRHVDVPPFSETHLRTTLGEFVTTSIGLIIEKPSAGSGRLGRFLGRGERSVG